MSQEEQIKLQKVWAVEIEVLERKLRLWSEHGAQGSPRFREAVERKQLLESEMENSKKLQALKAGADAEEKRKGMVSKEAASKPKSSIGQNIDRLRKECGWSFDTLAKQTGIDKKQILSHVNKGTKPHPRIMKEYAQAFTKELGSHITVADLEK
jgi:ribosome-binding protein aMBF1 (putative translation factor)